MPGLAVAGRRGVRDDPVGARVFFRHRYLTATHRSQPVDAGSLRALVADQSGGIVPSGFGSVANMRITNGVSARTVARQTLDALGRKGTVRPGLLSKLLEGSLAPLPRSLQVRILEQVMRGMTAHQRGTGP